MGYLDYPGLQRYHGKVQDEIDELKDDLTHIGISDSVKVALLNCFSHVAWIDEDGQDYYDALNAALYEADYPRIVAVFTPGNNPIYIDEGLNALKQYLVVKYQASMNAEDIIVPSTDYTLSGNLTEGDNVIRVAYNHLYTTFVVTAIDYYNIHEWSMANGLLKLWTNGGSGTKEVDNAEYAVLTNLSTRRAMYTLKGTTPCHNADNMSQIYNDKFPIPIPDDATTITVHVTPSSQYVNGHIAKRKENGEVEWLSQASPGWCQGTLIASLPDEVDRIFLPFLKYDSAGTTYPTNPSEFVVIFS